MNGNKYVELRQDLFLSFRCSLQIEILDDVFIYQFRKKRAEDVGWIRWSRQKCYGVSLRQGAKKNVHTKCCKLMCSVRGKKRGKKMFMERKMVMIWKEKHSWAVSCGIEISIIKIGSVSRKVNVEQLNLLETCWNERKTFQLFLFFSRKEDFFSFDVLCREKFFSFVSCF